MDITEYPGSVRIHPDTSNHTFASFLAQLHKSSWRNPTSLIRTFSVRRDSENRADIPLSDTATCIAWNYETKYPLSVTTTALGSILIRDEYVRMLYDIIHRAMNGETYDPNEISYASADTYNPFLSDEQKFMDVFGMIISGSPGIGKTTFLYYVLALRTMAGKITIIQISEEDIFVVEERGVYRIPSSEVNSGRHFDMDLPEGTWFLIDSNQDFESPGWFTVEQASRNYWPILQATLPIRKCLKWSRKVSRRCSHYWMAPWSLAELIIGRDLQALQPAADGFSEKMLESYYEKYGTFPHQAYRLLSDTKSNEMISKAIEGLDIPALHDLADEGGHYAWTSSARHLLTTLHPAPDRTTLVARFVSNYVFTRIWAELNLSMSKKASELCKALFYSPSTMASGDIFLKNTLLDVLPRGGTWKMREMALSPQDYPKNIHWRPAPGGPIRYLQVCGPVPFQIINDQPGEDEKFAPTPRYRFTHDQALNLGTGFYYPNSKNFLAFDAFFYDEERKHVAVVLTTCTLANGIPPSNMDWLIERGVETIDVIVVTPKLYGDDYDNEKAMNDLDIYTPISHRHHIRSVHQLVFEIPGDLEYTEYCQLSNVAAAH